MSRSWAVLMVAVVVCGLGGCGVIDDPWKDDARARKRVVVTIPPLLSWVKAIGGDDVAVRSLCEDTGPHHYDADMKTLPLFRRADLFLSIGLTLDDKFADVLHPLARRPDLPFVKLGQRLPKKMLIETKEDDHGHEGHHHHHHGKYDPHVWLGIDEAIHMVNVIAEQLSAIDKDHEKTYTENAKKYVEKLKALHARGKTALEGKVKHIISFHDSFQYFGRSFGFKTVAVMEMGPGDEPTAGHLKKLADLIVNKDKKHKKIDCITVEPQYRKGSADRLAKTLEKKGITVPVVEVDPLETAKREELAKDPAGWYVKKMEANLKALADALP